jgi:hypothetical protein
MPTRAFTRGVELRKKIKQAMANAIISLPEIDLGEFVGPVIIDKPMTIKGQGDMTPLMGRGCPAVIIKSPGVQLENLDLLDSYNPDTGVSLIYYIGMDPILKGTTPKGRTETMSKEHLIDLGDFLPQQQTSSYIEVEVKGPSRVNCAENCSKWLRVSPPDFPAAGKYLLQIGCDAKALGPDSIGAGNIEIITGTDSRVIWVTLNVLPASPSQLLKGSICLLLGRDQRIYFEKGFILGKNKFPGISAASSLPEKQAIILKEDSSGTWAVFQPWTTSQSTLVDGNPLAQGQRHLLQDGSTIRAGAIELKVEATTGAGTFSLSKPVLDLGIPGGVPPDKGFQVKNNGSGREKVKVVSTVAWLQASPAELDLKKGESAEILVSFTSAVFNLQPGKYPERAALLLIGKNEIHCVDAIANVQLVTAVPKAVPDQVKFGVVTEWSKAQATVAIRNAGTKEWKPTVQSEVEWLTVDAPSLTISPGKSENLTFKVNQKVERLSSPGSYSGRVVLEGDGLSLAIPVQADLQLKKVEISLETPILDFKELASWDQAVPSSVIVSNKGTADWEGKIRSTVNWLDILGGTDLLIPAGVKKISLVKLNGNLPVGKTHITDALIIEGTGKVLSIEVKGELKPPVADIDLFPRLVDFGKFDDLSSAGTKQVVFKNRGLADWHGILRCSLPWLECIPDEKDWKCPAKTEKVLSLRVKESLKEGRYELPDVVVFENPEGSFSVAIRAEYEPLPKPRALSVDFSEISGWETASPVTIPVFNDGKKDWKNIEVKTSVPWVTASLEAPSILHTGKADLKVRVNQKVDALQSGKFEVKDAILLEGDGISLPIEVKLVLPPYELQSTTKELSYTIEDGKDLAETDNKLTVSNTGRRNWSGRVIAQVPWLRITPDPAEIGAGGSLNFVASITEAVRNLGTGELIFGNLIAFEHTTLSMGVKVVIKKGSEVSNLLEFQPSPLDFGRIEEGVAGPAKSLALDLYCESDWQATFKAQENWFRVIPDSLGGKAGQHQKLQVELTDQAYGLDEGVHWSEIRLNQVGGKSQSVPVKIVRVETPPDIVMEPSSLDLFWHVPDGKMASQPFRIVNKGKKEVGISVSMAAGWLDVSPGGNLACPASGHIDYTVDLSAQAETLKDGKYNQDLVVRIGTRDRQSYPVSLLVDHSVVDMQVHPDGISFGPVEKSVLWDQNKQEEVTIRNNGARDLNLTMTIVKGAPWIETAGSLRIPHNAERKFNVGLKAGAWKMQRLGKLEGAIELSGAGKPRELIVSAQLVQSLGGRGGKIFDSAVTEKQVLVVQPQVITFEEQDQTKWRKVPAQRISITNPNDVEWSVTVKCVDWLAIQPSFLRIPINGTQELEVRLKPPTLFTQTSTSIEMYDRSDAIEISSGDLLIKIHVKMGTASIEHPESRVTPVSPPEKPAGGTVADRSERYHFINTVDSATDVLSIQPTTIDFGTVDDLQKAPVQTVTFTNISARPVQVSLKANDLYLVDPSSFTCPAECQVSVKVKLRARGAFAQITKGRKNEQNGIIVNANGTTFPIPVSVEII